MTGLSSPFSTQPCLCFVNRLRLDRGRDEQSKQEQFDSHGWRFYQIEGVVNSREKYIQSISQQMIADEEAIIKRLIQLREKRPKLYRSVPKAWQRAVVDYETEKKDVSHETNKRASLAKQS